mmetsp:Transcript_27286/g.39970  ORF Transcript_27286/g.39970 Transcript_27286/m.39970 type:complete len:213 (-) Transcript_27286:425-1063(-)
MKVVASCALACTKNKFQFCTPTMFPLPMHFLFFHLLIVKACTPTANSKQLLEYSTHDINCTTLYTHYIYTSHCIPYIYPPLCTLKHTCSLSLHHPDKFHLRRTLLRFNTNKTLDTMKHIAATPVAIANGRIHFSISCTSASSFSSSSFVMALLAVTALLSTSSSEEVADLELLRLTTTRPCSKEDDFLLANGPSSIYTSLFISFLSSSFFTS